MSTIVNYSKLSSLCPTSVKICLLEFKTNDTDSILSFYIAPPPEDVTSCWGKWAGVLLYEHASQLLYFEFDVLS